MYVCVVICTMYVIIHVCTHVSYMYKIRVATVHVFCVRIIRDTCTRLQISMLKMHIILHMYIISINSGVLVFSFFILILHVLTNSSTFFVFSLLLFLLFVSSRFFFPKPTDVCLNQPFLTIPKSLQILLLQQMYLF